MKNKTILATLVFLMCSVSYADYFKGGLGLGLSGEVELDNSASTTKTDIDGSFPSPFLVAYGFEMTDAMYGEIEFAHRNNDYDTAGVTGDVQVNSLAFNLAFRKEMDVVALNGGVGAFVGQFDIETAPSSDKETAFGLQFFGGGEYLISPDFGIGAELRYFMNITDIDLGNQSDASYNQLALIFTGRFLF